MAAVPEPSRARPEKVGCGSRPAYNLKRMHGHGGTRGELKRGCKLAPHTEVASTENFNCACHPDCPRHCENSSLKYFLPYLLHKQQNDRYWREELHEAVPRHWRAKPA